MDLLKKGVKCENVPVPSPPTPETNFLGILTLLLRRAYPLSRETQYVLLSQRRNRGYWGTVFRALLVGAYTFFLKVYGKIPDFPDFPLTTLKI
jgi:hypothetical protein